MNRDREYRVYHGIKYGLPISLLLWSLVVWMIFTCSGCTTVYREPITKDIRLRIVRQDNPHEIQQQYNGKKRVIAFVRCRDEARTDCMIVLPWDMPAAILHHEIWGHLMTNEQGEWNIPDGE